jgi:tetratricopeptide (TPR) repeat protein
LVRQGVTFLHRRSPFQTLESYQEALQHVKDVSPLLRARLYAGLAEVEGKLGMEQEARRSIGLAFDSFPSDVKNDPSALYVHFGQASLYLHEGLALLDLHKPEEALEALVKVDGLHPKMAVSERSRVDFLNQQALAAGQVKDLDQFSLYIEAAVTSAKALGSDLRLSEAWDIYRRTQGQWGNEQQIKELAELFKR